MLLPFLLCVLILYAPLPDSAGAVDPWVTLGGVAGLAALTVLAGWLCSTLAVYLLRRRDPMAAPGSALRDVMASRLLSLLSGLVIGFTAADVFVFGWPMLVYRLLGVYRWMVLLDDLLLLLPALLMMLAVIMWRYRVESLGRPVSPGMLRYLWLRVRVELGVILVPWLLLVSLTDLAKAVFHGFSPLAGAVVSGAAVVLLLSVSPLLLRAIWGTSRLPDGALRQRLEAFSVGHGFRCNDILLWHTHNHIANAGVIGPLPFLRYVLLTDVLVSRCTEEEVEAVFAHEVGHIRRHHLAFYFLFAVAFFCFYVNLVDLVALSGRVGPLTDVLGLQMTPPQAVVMLLFAVAYWALVFGFVSRRMEQQADMFSLRSIERPEALLSALDKLGALGHAPRRASFWRHFSIDRRIAFLRRIMSDPAKARGFDLRIAALKGGIIALSAAGFLRLLLYRPGLFGL